MEDAQATGTACDRQLPTVLQLHVLSFLPPTDRALSGRLVSPDAAATLSKDPTCTASLSQPLPPHAVRWAVEAGRQHVRQLPFRHKLQLLCTAAASGSKANLQVALAVLQPSVFLEVLQSPGGYPDVGASVHRASDCCGGQGNMCGYWDAGVAAVKARHPQLLSWLLRRCPGVVNSRRVLEAAAHYCSLEGLQAAYAALRGHPNCGKRASRHILELNMLDAACSSPTPDALGKMEWLVSMGGRAYRLRNIAAVAAARSGDLGRLQWLRDRGCPMDLSVLKSALQHADLAVAQWLVDEVGVSLPGAGGGGGQGPGWRELLAAAAQSAGGVVKLQWLQERGAPLLEANAELLRSVAAEAIAAGHVQVAQYLWTAFGAGGVLFGSQAAELAGRSGSIPMLQWLRQAGVELSHTAYEGAGRAASLAVVRWLAQEAGVSAAGIRLESMQDLILRWPNTAARSRELLQAVQLMAGAGYSNWGMHHVAVTWSRVVGRGDLALMQYLEQQQLQHMCLQQQQQQQQGLQPAHWSAARLLWSAVDAGCEALLQWLVEQQLGGPEGVGAESPYVHPATHGDLGTLNTLRRLGVPWGAEDVVVQAVRDGCSVPALQWLVEQDAPMGSEQEVQAAAREAYRSSVRMWMSEQGWLADDMGAEEASAHEWGRGTV